MAMSEHLKRLRQRLRTRGHTAFPGVQTDGPVTSPPTNDFGELVEELDLDKPDLPVAELLEPVTEAPNPASLSDTPKLAPNHRSRLYSLGWSPERRAVMRNQTLQANARKMARMAVQALLCPDEMRGTAERRFIKETVRDIRPIGLQTGERAIVNLRRLGVRLDARHRPDLDATERLVVAAMLKGVLPDELIIRALM